jgi:mannose-6-phosphate isomerase-like protein (cupin superfamily)
MSLHHFSHPQSEYFFSIEGCHIWEIHNHPADPELSVARARVPPGITTRWHRLYGVTERYMIQDGWGRVELGGEPAREVAAGDVVVIPPGVDQRITNIGSTDLVFLAVCTPRFTPNCYRSSEA